MTLKSRFQDLKLDLKVGKRVRRWLISHFLHLKCIIIKSCTSAPTNYCFMLLLNYISSKIKVPNV